MCFVILSQQNLERRLQGALLRKGLWLCSWKQGMADSLLGYLCTRAF
mgnify:CR=1 FL=1|jgi:hypothetical protein